MSEWSVVEVEFNDEQILAETLKSMGYNPKIHQEAVEIRGYGGRMSKKANIVVSKNQFSGYTDCGFERQVNGGYKLHLDNMDHKKFKVGKLKQCYTETKLTKVVGRTSAFSIKSRTVNKDGKIKIRIRRVF